MSRDSGSDQGIGFNFLARMAWRERAQLIVVAIASGGLCFAASFFIPESYRATASVIPASQTDGLGSLGALSSALGSEIAGLALVSSSGAIDPVMFGDIIESRRLLKQLLEAPVSQDSSAVQTPLIAEIGAKGSGEKRLQLAIKRLRRDVDVRLDRRTGIVYVSARAPRPELAANIANRLCQLLQQYVLNTLTTQAGENRRFVEERLAETRQTLRAAKEELKLFRERNVRIGNSPRLQLEEERLTRALREQEEIFLTLRREAERATIEERRDVPALNLLDTATPPIQREWPKRKLLGLLGALVGAAVALALSVSRSELNLVEVRRGRKRIPA